MTWRIPPNDPPVDYLDFADFYTNPFIQSIANKCRWSISDADKKPIDMHRLMYYNDPTRGAQFTDKTSMRTLPEICQFMPQAANNAFHLEASVDQVCILDIEKTCPDNLKQQLLQLPYLYAEVSMSGKGYHLALPVSLFTDLFNKYPNAQGKAVIKKKNKDFELLFEHWVTFTRNTKNIPPYTGTADVNMLFDELFAEQVAIVEFDFEMNDKAEDEQYRLYRQSLFEQTVDTYHKTPADYDNDLSRFEYAKVIFIEELLYLIIAKTVAYQADINNRLVAQGRPNECKILPTADASERAWLVYEVAQATIPHRDKHNEIRNGMPWLMYYAQKAVAANKHLAEQNNALYAPREKG